MKATVVDVARMILASKSDSNDPGVILAGMVLDDWGKPGKCKDGPKDMPPGPWKAIKVALNSDLLFRLVKGESVIIDHRQLPPDAELMAVRQNGVEAVLVVGSQTYDARTCQCTIPTLRINYSTGG